MSNLMVIDEEEQTRVPFLRGILTRSLQNAGLAFDDSYRLANEVRDELGDAAEITNVELRSRIRLRLRGLDPQIAEQYDNVLGSVESMLVRSPDGDTSPYSRGRQRLDLLSSGLTPDEAAGIVAELFRMLNERGEVEIDAGRLCELTHETIERELGGKAASRYMVWQDHEASDRPLLVLVGGTVGTGKSTISTELARRLGIVRIQSTDMLREVMRSLVPEQLLPALFQSTYTAWQALPATEQDAEPSDSLLADGYLSQSEPVSLAYQAVVQRALKERVSLILEGVHVHPAWLSQIPRETDAIVVPLMLAVLSRKQLRKRIKGRGRRAPDRRAERYLSNFDAIWQLQSFLLSEADHAGIPIVFNEDKDATVQQAMFAVLRVLSQSAAGADTG
ncbi:MAG: AAA family ATPase [Gemmatimonadota bacterium]|nr:AAA family ATPase [Gemmatimonadota bacterium]